MLNHEQQQAIQSEAKTTLVLAGAGTGKTTVLIRRLEYLAKRGRKVLLLAFSRAVVREIKARMAHLGVEADVHTFHSLAWHLCHQLHFDKQQVLSVQSIDERVIDLQTYWSDPAWYAKLLQFMEHDAIYNYYHAPHYLAIEGFGLSSFSQDYIQTIPELRVAIALDRLGHRYIYRPMGKHGVRASFYLPEYAYDIQCGIFDSKAQLYLPDMDKGASSAQQLAWENPYLPILRTCLGQRGEVSFGLPQKQYLLNKRITQLFKWLDGREIVHSEYPHFNLLGELLADLQTRYAHLLSFRQMLVMASHAVRDRDYAVPWQDILVDECQDMSAEQYDLLQSLLHRSPETRIFLVGDDWQSIFAFAGSDIRYITEVMRHFHGVRTYYLTQTYRFHEQIAQPAMRFILQNPEQSHKFLQAPSYHGVAFYLVSNQLAISKIMRELKQDTVLVLGRFHDDLPPPYVRQQWQSLYPNMRFFTIHASKGLEADHVILLNANADSLPADRDYLRDPFLEQLYPTPSTAIEHAEERRLFYVAITRARKTVWMMSDPKYTSPFVLELCRYIPKKHLRIWKG